ARRQDRDRQASPADGLPAPERLPRPAVAGRDPDDRQDGDAELGGQAGGDRREAQAEGGREAEVDQAGGVGHGTQERARLLAQRARLEPEDARREDVRRPGREGRDDHRSPARDALPARPGYG